MVGVRGAVLPCGGRGGQGWLPWGLSAACPANPIPRQHPIITLREESWMYLRRSASFPFRQSHLQERTSIELEGTKDMTSDSMCCWLALIGN